MSETQSRTQSKTQKSVNGNVVNLYRDPNTDSEMVSQMIFGAVVYVLDEQHGFSQVVTEDRYQSWVDSCHLTAPTDDLDTLSTITTLFADVYAAPDAHAEILTKLTVGATVTRARRAGVDAWVPLSFPNGQIGYVHQVSLPQTHGTATDNLRTAADSGLARQTLISALGRQIAETAKRFVGTPYLWGGTTPFGIDCSGLTQLVYRLNGIQLLRDAYQQFADKRFVRVEDGQSLETAILEEGDLVAFSRRDDKRPTHIGIALGDGRFLHARGGFGVRVDFCDTAEYVQTYLGAVRLSANAEFSIQSA